MKAECPRGHTENLSHEELGQRLNNHDFECRQCMKDYSYEVDRRFWTEFEQGRFD